MEQEGVLPQPFEAPEKDIAAGCTRGFRVVQERAVHVQEEMRRRKRKGNDAFQSRHGVNNAGGTRVQGIRGSDARSSAVCSTLYSQNAVFIAMSSGDVCAGAVAPSL